MIKELTFINKEEMVFAIMDAICSTLALLAFLLSADGFPDYGFTGQINTDIVNSNNNRWVKVAGWSSGSKHGFYAKGLNMDANASSFTITRGGIYFVHFRLTISISGNVINPELSNVTRNETVLRTLSPTTVASSFQGETISEIEAACSLNGNTDEYTVTSSRKSIGKGHNEFQGNNIIKIDRLGKLAIFVQVRNSKSVYWNISRESFLSIRWINNIGSAPGFSANLISTSKLYSVRPSFGPWRAFKSWHFTSSTGFNTEKKSIQISCSGIYLVTANVILNGTLANHTVMLKLRGKISNKMNQTKSIATISETSTVNGVITFSLVDVLSISRGNILFFEVDLPNKTDLVTGSWSLQFLNKINQLTHGIRTSLTTQIDLSTQKSFKINSWSSTPRHFMQFKSPSSLNLVSNRAFSPSKKDTYVLSIRLSLFLQQARDASVTASLMLRGIPVISSTQSIGLVNSSYAINLAGVYSLSTSDPVEVGLSYQQLSLPNNPVRVEGDFSIIQLQSASPGLAARLDKDSALTKSKWIEIKNLTAAKIYGAFDFNYGFSSATGRYKVPNDGVYLAFANIVVVDIDSEIKTLISINSMIEIESGLYARDGNPSQTITLNIGGLLKLRKGQEISVYTYAKEDSDWNLRRESGLSIGYLGQVQYGFRSHTRNVQEIKSSGRTIIAKHWTANTEINQFHPSESGKVLLQLDGVYYSVVNIILGEADSQQSSSVYEIQLYADNKPLTGLVARRATSGVKEPSSNRHYTLYFSGSFEGKKGQIITLQVYSENDQSYQIQDGSGWSMVYISPTAATVGFNAYLSRIQYTFDAKANNWFHVEPWTSNRNKLGAFMTSTLFFDMGRELQIPSRGLYLISFNIHIIYNSQSKPIFQVMLFNSDDVIDSGVAYVQNKLYNEYTMHSSGVLALNAGDKISVKIKASDSFNDASIQVPSNWNLLKLPSPSSYNALMTLLKENTEIMKSPTVIKDWSSTTSMDSPILLSWPTYIQDTGQWMADHTGLYFISLNFMLNDPTDSSEVTISLTKNVTDASTDLGRWTIQQKQRHVQFALSIVEHLNIGEKFSSSVNHNQTIQLSNNSMQSFRSLTLLKDSSISILYLQNAERPKNYKSFVQETSLIAANFEGEMNAWKQIDSSTLDGGTFLAQKSGFYFITVKMVVSNFRGQLQVIAAIGSAKHIVFKEENEKNASTTFIITWTGKLGMNQQIKYLFKTGDSSTVTLHANSTREVYYLDSDSKSSFGALKSKTKTFTQDKILSWSCLDSWEIDKATGFSGTLSHSNEAIIIRETGLYLVLVTLIVDKIESTNSFTNFTVRISTSASGGFSTGLSTIKTVAKDKAFTVSLSSVIFIEKWNKLGVIIQLGHESEKAVISDRSTMTALFINSFVSTDCPDPGPYLPSPLVPSFVGSGIVGEKRSWKCNAFADGVASYTWWKNNKQIKTKVPDTLEIEGRLEDSGEYYCQASYLGYSTTSSKVSVDIFDVDECFYGNHSCPVDADCKNTPGSFSCSCRQGFHGHSSNCTDIDECATNKHDCHKNALCKNLIGGFSCECAPGYLGDGKKECNNIKECAILKPTCDINARCQDDGPGYRCACNSGWTGNGTHCHDVNECASGIHPCHPNATCINTNGTFLCECRQGFSGNGHNCTDVNECTQSNTTCPSTSTCNNLIGGYICQCNSGFTGNGSHCHDIDECASSPSSLCGTNADCRNSFGSYDCVCHIGLSGNGRICLDVDECKEKDKYCDPLANCSNTYKSYICSCPRGYVGSGKTCTKGGTVGRSTDACENDKGSLQCICKDSNARDKNILCNGLFVAIIILVVVAIIVVVFGFKYLKSRRITKIAPAKTAKGKYIEMEDESEV